MSAVRYVVWPDAPKGGGAADYFSAGGTVEGLAALIHDSPPWAETKAETVETPRGPEIISAVDLLAKRFKPPKWAVPELLMEGLIILAGRPKLGKSWLGLGLAKDVAAGGLALGKIRTLPGETLYLALEDGPRRMQERLQLLLGEEDAPARMHVATEWRKIDESGLEDLDAWLALHPDCRLVCIDTFKRIRSRPNAKARLYDDDYDAMLPLADLARKHAVAIVVVLHARKGEAVDPLDLISGTTGLSGAADAALVLRRERGQADASLFVTGRDIEERDMALKWHGKDADTFGWEWIGDAEEFRLSRERSEILEAVSRVPGMKPHEIADAIGRPRGAVRFLLFKMVHDAQVRVKVDSTYWPPINTGFPDHSANSANSGNTATTRKQLTDPPPPVSPVTPVISVTPASAVSGEVQKPMSGWPCIECGATVEHRQRKEGRCPPCHARYLGEMEREAPL